MDIQDKVMVDFAAAKAGKLQLRGTKDSGSAANRVRIKTVQGSQFDGRSGLVVQVRDDTVFVRIQIGSSHSITLPFAPGELEVIA